VGWVLALKYVISIFRKLGLGVLTKVWLLVFTVGLPVVQAQETTTDRIIQQEQQRQEQQFEELTPTQLPRDYLKERLDDSAVGDDTSCIDIQTITLEGADVLSANRAAWSKLSGLCTSTRHVNRFVECVGD